MILKTFRELVVVLASLTDETLHGSLASTSFQIRVINDCDMTWQISCGSNVVMKNVIFYTLVVREIRKKIGIKMLNIKTRSFNENPARKSCFRGFIKFLKLTKKSRQLTNSNSLYLLQLILLNVRVENFV